MTEFRQTLEKEIVPAAIFDAIQIRQAELSVKLRLFAQTSNCEIVGSIDELDDLMLIRAFHETVMRPWTWMRIEELWHFDRETEKLGEALSSRDGRSTDHQKSASYLAGQRAALKAMGHELERMAA